MNENGLKLILWNLSHLVYLGDGFQAYSHPSKQDLARSRSFTKHISVLAVWPRTVFSSAVAKCTSPQPHAAVVSLKGDVSCHLLPAAGVRDELGSDWAGREGKLQGGCHAVLLCLSELGIASLTMSAVCVCKIKKKKKKPDFFPWREQTSIFKTCCCSICLG